MTHSNLSSHIFAASPSLCESLLLALMNAVSDCDSVPFFYSSKNDLWSLLDTVAPSISVFLQSLCGS